MAAQFDYESVSQALRLSNNQQQSIPRTFKINDKCLVFSRSRQTWFIGQITAKTENTEGCHWSVKYKVNDEYAQKTLSITSKHLKPFNIETDQEYMIIKCLCKQAMKLMYSKECYNSNDTKNNNNDNNNKDHDNEDNKDSEPTVTQVSCDRCNKDIDNNKQFYHCPNEKNEIHTYGYDLCQTCAMKEYGIGCSEDEMDVTIDNEQKLDDEDAKNDDEEQIARQLGQKPFAQGGTRYAYLGMYTSGAKKGKRCVIKRYKNKHTLASEAWEGDIKCCELAFELVSKWNEMNLVNKKYEIIVPTIARKGGSIFGWHLLLLLMEENENENKKHTHTPK